MTGTKRARFFIRYRSAILFNKNLLIAGAGGFLISAYVSQLYYEFDQDEFANSVVTLAAEYAVYLPLFSLLYYIDERQKYIDPVTGKKNGKQIRADVKKLTVAFSVSEVIYSVTRVATQYGLLLQLTIEPYQASMVSALTASAVYFVAINGMAELTRLFYPSR